jgi:hypothetical protein
LCHEQADKAQPSDHVKGVDSRVSRLNKSEHDAGCAIQNAYSPYNSIKYPCIEHFPNARSQAFERLNQQSVVYFINIELVGSNFRKTEPPKGLSGIFEKQ